MKLNTKIWILIILFSIRGVLYLWEGILGLGDGVTYGEYGNAFVYAGIMGYIVYLLYSTRHKWVYWTALIFTGFALLQFVMGVGLIAYSGIALSMELMILAILNVTIFGIIPLLLLLNKELRGAYLTQK